MRRKQLDETTMELKKTSLALEQEKQKTEELLHDMLPEKVARQLTQGLAVKAGQSWSRAWPASALRLV